MPDIRTFTAPTRWAGALIDGNSASLTDETYAAVQDCIESLIQKHGNDFPFAREDLDGQPRRREHYGKGTGEYSIYHIHHTLPAKKATP